MTDYTEDDVERLADILGEAQKRGIKHGSYTLARWILTAWQVEGSTPIASPAPCVGICGDSAPQIFPNTVPVVCSLPHGHAGWHHADGGGDWTERAPADEPAPVAPPVDALLVLLDKWLEEDVDDHTANGWAAIREDIETRARALWAAGVAEGRRLLDETAATAAVHAYELGVAEGRRQATEERTEVERG